MLAQVMVSVTGTGFLSTRMYIPSSRPVLRPSALMRSKLGNGMTLSGLRSVMFAVAPRRWLIAIDAAAGPHEILVRMVAEIVIERLSATGADRTLVLVVTHRLL